MQFYIKHKTPLNLKITGRLAIFEYREKLGLGRSSV